MRIKLPYIHTTSEMTARLLRPFNIDLAHKPTCKRRSQLHETKRYLHFSLQKLPGKVHWTNIDLTEKIQTRLVTENRNAVNKHDHSSLPAKHADDNGHKFDRSQTRCLGQTTTKHAREFKEAWYSMDELTFSRHIA